MPTPRKPSARPARKPGAKPGPRPGAKPSVKPSVRATAKPKPKAKVSAKAGAKPRVQAAVKPTVRPASTTATKPAPRPHAGGMAKVPSLTRVKWSGFRVLLDFWGQPMKRYYQLETLANATEAALSWKNSFLYKSVHEALGPADVSALNFELFQEGRYQLIFRLRASNIKGGSTQFAYVAAKNHEECSDIARAEHHNLRTLYERMPQWVTRPYWGGTVVLPDRHKRKEHDRLVYTYFTSWLNGYEELGVTRNLQFYVNVEKKHTFTLAETELLHGQMLEIIASSHDETSRTAMALPQIASGDFVVNRQGGLKLKLIACRRMQQKITRHKLLSQVLTEGFEWGGRTFKLAPEEPSTVLAALTRAWGEEAAIGCIRFYLSAVAAGNLPGKKPGYLTELRALITEKTQGA